MRLLIESPNCNPTAGSNAAVGFGWASHLARDHEVHVVTYADAYGDSTPPDGMHVISIPPGGTAKLGRRTDFVVQATTTANKLIDRVKPDVVHTVEPGGWGGPRGLATTRVPYVLGPIAGGAVEHPRGFSAEVLNSLPVSPARGLFGGGAKRFGLRLWNEALFGAIPTTRWLGHRAMKQARLILLATSVARGAIPKSSEPKIRRIPLMGLDLDAFRPAPKPDGPFTVLYAGRIVSIKCLHLVLDAAAKSGAHVRIAGSAPPEESWYEEFCRARAIALGIAERVTWLGTVPRAELAREYAAADLYVMLSLWDTYGLTYAEAMACGTPVVGLAAGGAAEIVTGDTGWLVQPTTVDGAVEQLAERFEAAAGDRAELRELGDAARAYAERTYAWDALVDRMNGFYAEIAR